jgi:hypothetical protein
MNSMHGWTVNFKNLKYVLFSKPTCLGMYFHSKCPARASNLLLCHSDTSPILQIKTKLSMHPNSLMEDVPEV